MIYIFRIQHCSLREYSLEKEELLSARTEHSCPVKDMLCLWSEPVDYSVVGSWLIRIKQVSQQLMKSIF